MLDEVDDVVADIAFRGAGDAGRLVEADVDFLFLAGADHGVVDTHFVGCSDLCAQFRALAVDGDAAIADPGIRRGASTSRFHLKIY